MAQSGDGSSVPVVANPFDPGSPSAQAQQQQQPAATMSTGEQRLLEVLAGVQQTQTLLAQLAQQQAVAAAQPAVAAPSASSGLAAKDLSKVLKHPQEFGCKTRDEELIRWATWSWEFEQYLGTLDRAYIVDFKRLADHPKQEVVFGTLSDEEKERSRIMYGLLASLVNDRLRRVLKTIADQNGYEGYRQISLDLKPSSRTRALALMTAISQWPIFDGRQGLLAQVVKLEQAMAEYDSIASQALSDDQRVASLLRCLSGPLMKHVQLVMEDHWDYSMLRALVLRFDAASSKWSSSIAATYGLGDGRGSQQGGPTPMEIDRIGKGKGKGKDKGKDKGKGKYQNPQNPQSGKGKDKGKDKGKGKHQNPQNPQSGKGNYKATALCGWCQKPGHYKRECRAFQAYLKQQGRDQGARQVQDTSSATSTSGSASVAASSVPSSAGQLQANAKAKVNRVAYVDLTSLSPSGPSLGGLRALRLAEDSADASVVADGSPTSSAAVDMSASDDDDCWTVCPALCEQNVRAVSRTDVDISIAGAAEIDIIIDSGADESCLPAALAWCGTSIGASIPDFADAQGHLLDIKDHKTVLLELPNAAGDLQCFRESCLVSSVSSPLFAVGKLYRMGWSCFWEDERFYLGRQGEPETYIPIFFKHNSLFAKCYVRRVQASKPAIRVVAKLGAVLQKLAARCHEFQELVPGVWCLSVLSDRFVDVTSAMPLAVLPYRTTLVEGSDGWELLEISELVETLPDPACMIPGIAEPRNCIVFAHSQVRSPEELGFSTDSTSSGGLVPRAESSGDRASADPASSEVPEVEMSSELPVEAEPDGAGDGGAQASHHRSSDASLHVRQSDEAPESLPEELDVQGVVIRPTDTLKVLRKACELCGVGKSGGKATVYRRLAAYVAKHRLELQSHPAAADQVIPQQVTPVVEPSTAERELHELTHLPFQPWCTVCMQNKGRSDPHKGVDATHRAQTVVSFDFSFTGRDEEAPDSKLVCLVLHDRHTGWREALPVPRRGGSHSKHYLASEVTRIMSFLGHKEASLRCDPENVCLALQQEIVRSRTRIGLKTQPEQSPEGEHASNGGAEQAVNNCRLQANVILAAYERDSGCKVSTMHPLHAWGTRHASWLLNRYGLKASGTTAFEDATGHPYDGKVVQFGQSVLCFCKGKVKGAPKWLQGMWLGKTNSSDQHICITAGGRLILCRSIRCMIPKFDKSLHDVIKAQPWQHSSFLSGTAGRSQAQKLVVSIEDGDDAAPLPAAVDDGIGVGLAAPAGTPDEAGSDPPSDEENGGASEFSPSTPEVDADEVMNDDTLLQDLVPQAAAGAAEDTVQTSTGSDSVDRPAAVVREAPPDEENVERPAKVLKPAGSSHKAPRVNAINFVGEHNDEATVPRFEHEELDLLDDYDYSLDSFEHHDDSKGGGDDTPPELFLPKVGDAEPELSSAALAELDSLADWHEMNRLSKLGVLVEIDASDEAVSTSRLLSTKHVRTWRIKPDPTDGTDRWMRRSRFVAREFAWLDPDREGLYSPASNHLLVRLLPSLFMSKRSAGEDWSCFGLDVKDAFLTVPQVTPTVVKAEIQGTMRYYRLAFMLPGQRDGTSNWYSAFVDFLKDSCQLEPFPQCPALLATPDKKLGILLHVDDVFGTGATALANKVREQIEQRYVCSSSMMSKPGDVIVFLKRSHELISEDLLLIRPHPKHVQRLCKLLNIGSRKPKAAPMPVNPPEDGASLGPADATTFRAAVGTLLYLAPDVIPAQNAIRWLAQRMSAPTVGAMKVCKHLVSYLQGVSEHSIGFASGEPGVGCVAQSRDNPHVLELFTDADWSGDKTTRRSTSSNVIMHNGHTLCTASRTQKSVSLSSCESEFNAYVSGMTDLVYVSSALTFLTGSDPERHTFLDSSSARQLVCRQGVGRVRHLSGKLLWVQEFLKQGYMTIHPVDTLLNVSDIGTKALAPERIAALSFILGIRDGELQLVGEREHRELVEKIRLRKVVRALQKQPIARQPDVLQHALRIAVILSEIQEVSALGQSASLPIAPRILWTALWMIAVLCMIFLQGCESYEAEHEALEVLIWSFLSKVYGNPVTSSLVVFAVWIVPCIYMLIQCCCFRKQVIEVKIVQDKPAAADVCSNNSASTAPPNEPSVAAAAKRAPAPPNEPSASAAGKCAPAPPNEQSACAGIPPPVQPANVKLPVPKAARPPKHYRERDDTAEHVIVTGNRGYAYHSRATCPNLRNAKRTQVVLKDDATREGYKACKVCVK